MSAPLARAAIVLAALALALPHAPEAQARPGGGQSFGGSSKSSGGRSSSGSSKSSGGSSSWGSSKSSGSSNWSSKPSYAAPWSAPESKAPPKPVGPHGTSSGYNYTSPPGPASGSVGEFFFFILLALGVIALVVAGYAHSRRREERDWASGVLGEDDDHVG